MGSLFYEVFSQNLVFLNDGLPLLWCNPFIWSILDYESTILYLQNIHEINMFIFKVMWFISISPQYLFHSWLVRYGEGATEGFLGRKMVHVCMILATLGSHSGVPVKGAFKEYGTCLHICIYDIYACMHMTLAALIWSIETLSMAVQEFYALCKVHFPVIGNYVKS